MVLKDIKNKLCSIKYLNMKKLKFLKYMILPVILLAFACDDDDNGGNDDATESETFAREAAYSNMAEIEMGELATQYGDTAFVREFGELMIVEHEKAQDELDSLADELDLDLPNTLKEEHQLLWDSLSILSGHTFDSAYIQSQIRAHTATANMFIAFIDTSDDVNLKAYANKYLPAVQLHLQKADSIANEFEDDYAN